MFSISFFSNFSKIFVEKKFLSKEKKQMVMQKFQDEAKSRGIELPSVFTDLDPSSGMPAILKATTAEQTEKFVEKANEELQKKPALKPINLVDAGVQVKF